MGEKTVRVRVRSWKDDFPLAVSVFSPAGDIYGGENIVVVINSATGVLQAFYAPFARLVLIPIEITRYKGFSLNGT
jgi:hypothetical protein